MKYSLWLPLRVLLPTRFIWVGHDSILVLCGRRKETRHLILSLILETLIILRFTIPGVNSLGLVLSSEAGTFVGDNSLFRMVDNTSLP